MNSITAFLLAAVIIGFLGPVLTILSVIQRVQNASAKENQRVLQVEIREVQAKQRAELHAMKLTKEDNDIVYKSLKIEIERLKLAALEREINPPKFDPTDYPPS